MTGRPDPAPELEGTTIEISRVFDAPRELVFKTWTEPEHLKQWWGPTGWTLPVCEIDLRTGGVWHYCMRSPDGVESWGRAVYREIDPPERLVYVDTFSDEEGNAKSREMLITVTFEERGDRTLVTMRTLFESPEHRASVLDLGAVEGMNQTLDRLAEHLAIDAKR